MAEMILIRRGRERERERGLNSSTVVTVTNTACFSCFSFPPFAGYTFHPQQKRATRFTFGFQTETVNKCNATCEMVFVGCEAVREQVFKADVECLCGLEVTLCVCVCKSVRLLGGLSAHPQRVWMTCCLGRPAHIS